MSFSVNHTFKTNSNNIINIVFFLLLYLLLHLLNAFVIFTFYQGNGCHENCLNLPGSSDTALAMGLCTSEADCALQTWPVAAQCVNPQGANGKCVPSPRGNAVGTYTSTCNMCVSGSTNGTLRMQTMPYFF